MKKIPMTIYVPEDTLKDLYTYIPSRKRSQYIVNLLEDALKEKKEETARDFRYASKDNIRNSEKSLWDTIEDKKNG